MNRHEKSSSITSTNFQSVFESLPAHALVLCTDAPTFTIVAATRALLDDLSMQADEVIGMGVFELLTENHQSGQMRTTLEHAFLSASRTHEQRRVLVPGYHNGSSAPADLQGRLWEATVSPVTDDNGQMITCVFNVADSPSNERARETLVESILEASFNGIYALEAVRDMRGAIVDFTYRFANGHTARLLGMTSEEIVGKRMLDLLPENRSNGFFDVFCRVLATGETIHDQTFFVSKQMKHWFNYVIVPIAHDTLVVTIQDVSEQKRDEEILRDQKRRLECSLEDLKSANDSLERFAYAASHDLQEPLRKVQMFSDMLIQHSGAQLDKKGQSYLDKIGGSVSRMKQLVTDLLEFSQQSKSASYNKPVDLNELLTNVESDLEVRIQQQQARILRNPLPVVAGNPSQLNQLFYNLYTNALKFSKVGQSTRITITSRTVDSARERSARDSSRRYVAILLSDNGIGFDEKYAEKIFELFSRLHSSGEYEGTGIGLALCKRIAQNHGGDIVASSNDGQGASFEVFLPLMP